MISRLTDIVLADDHPILLEGIESLIRKKFPHINIHKAFNGAMALQMITKFKPQVAVLDIEMPLLDGIEVARKVFENHFPTKIIILTLHRDPSFLREIKKLPIHGYLLKEYSSLEILKGIEHVCRGKKYYSEMLKNMPQSGNSELRLFTSSERNVLTLIAKGFTTVEIAERLFVSPKTVESHRYNICKKLHLKEEKNSLLRWVMQNKHLFKG